MNLLELSRVKAAAGIIAGKIHNTPLLSAHRLGRPLGVNLFFKCDNLQKTGSFKARGNCYRMHSLAGEKKAVVAYSSGNHGLALAWAAGKAGVDACIVMPETVPEIKLKAAQGYGAECLLCGTVVDAYAKAKAIVAEQKRLFIPAFEDPEITAGHGSATLEIIDALPTVDTIVVGIGGGGLIGGMAAAAKQINPRIRIIGVEPTGADSMVQSLKQGHAVQLTSVNTICDGLAAPKAGELAFELVQTYVDDVVTVNDDETVRALKLLLSTSKLVCEPSAAAVLAAVLEGRVRVKQGENIVVFLSGGNIDLEKLKTLIE